jgi:FkbM family methyltransferase
VGYLLRVARKLNYLFKLYCLRDPFLRNVKRWFADRGDDTLRLEYPLDKSSVVFDVGGYHGDFAEAIHARFGCRVYLFEPVPVFFEKCVTRFMDNPSVICLNYGLSSSSGWFEINLNADESSFKRDEEGYATQRAEVRSFSKAVSELGVESIDLIKINIEGAEFDLLPAIIESGLIKQVRCIQIQFHNFVEGAVDNRHRIRKLLEKTHREMWNYEFVWESWERL